MGPTSAPVLRPPMGGIPLVQPNNQPNQMVAPPMGGPPIGAPSMMGPPRQVRPMAGGPAAAGSGGSGIETSANDVVNSLTNLFNIYS